MRGATSSYNGAYSEYSASFGKIGIWTAEQMTRQRDDVAYFPFDLGEEERREPGLIASLLTDLLAEFNQA